ncbi:MAG: hypothetical protein L0J24_06920 [Corynebacterium flavescens]|uniref:hypothetical protein n=1 Tax=Corynebacterium flavescens TaxID=28028 RepID=UPI0026484047|nr:hypothetical protein [Corynebacterium flavescens]MDN6236421.1 hypothetical protein [Corynebacterium flavescens]
MILHLTGGIVAGVLFQVAFFAALIDFRSNDRTVIDEDLQLGLELGLGFRGNVLLLLLSNSETFRWDEENVRGPARCLSGGSGGASSSWGDVRYIQ